MRTKRHKFTLKLHEILEVPITARHIATAIPGSQTQCMIALGLRDQLRAHGLDFPSRGDGVGFPLIKFKLGPEQAAANERYTCVVLAEGLIAQKQFDEKVPLGPFLCRMQVVFRGLATKLGSRASRGLPPKAFHQKRNRARATCTTVRRYHQIKVNGSVLLAEKPDVTKNQGRA